MNQSTKFTVSLLIAGLFGGYLFGNYYPFLETSQFGGVSAPVIPLVEEWHGTVTGDVVEINSESITISLNQQTLTVSFSDELNISETTVSNNGPSETIENLSVDDIEIGDKVGLSIVADNNGNVQTGRINLIGSQL